jgi:hypothetical protein
VAKTPDWLFATASITNKSEINKQLIIYKRESLKTPKSRLATEAKAEFTKVNEHFADGA